MIGLYFAEKYYREFYALQEYLNVTFLGGMGAILKSMKYRDAK